MVAGGGGSREFDARGDLGASLHGIRACLSQLFLKIAIFGSEKNYGCSEQRMKKGGTFRAITAVRRLI